VTDSDRFQTIRDHSRPSSRAELHKPRDSLWDAIPTPAFNNTEYEQARATAENGIQESAFGGKDPKRFTCRREAPRLEKIYLAMRSKYTKMHTRNCQMKGVVFKEVNGQEHQLLYLQCLLSDNPWVDFALPSMPQDAQAEVGLPVSPAVRRWPGCCTSPEFLKPGHR